MNGDMIIRSGVLAALSLAVTALIFLLPGEARAQSGGTAAVSANRSATVDPSYLLFADNRDRKGSGDDRGRGGSASRTKSRSLPRRDLGWGHGSRPDNRRPARTGVRSDNRRPARTGVRSDKGRPARTGVRSDNGRPARTGVRQDTRRGGTGGSVRQDPRRARGQQVTRGKAGPQVGRGDIIRQRQRPVTRGQSSGRDD
ncbi:MAG: hypothetical protein LBQ79_05700 [Deltaproteobacteria bacterium]|jgi:hypothetical protein|nr:hypothetical protein [Deltaproteobacteria bacterium]